MSEIVRDPYQEALNELIAFGLDVDRLELGPPKGKKVWRVKCEGDKGQKKSGWYVAYDIRLDDGSMLVVGSYGRFDGAEKIKHKFSLKGTSLSDADRKQVSLRQKELARDSEAADAELQREVSERAKAIWDKLPSCSDSPYLTRKGVAAYGLGLGRDQTCVVPLRNSAGLLTQLQFISPDGTKRFLTGPGKAGSFHLIGTIVDELPLVFAEGYATAASIHQATSWPVVVCIDANNMLEVGRRLRPIYGHLLFVFAADDDHEKKRNTGREIVTEGAKRYRGVVVFPRFKEPGGRTDFNDVHAEQGLDAVREQVEAVVTPAQPDGPRRPAREGWERELVFGPKGGLDPGIHNVMLVLENHKDWQGVLGYNKFANRIVKRREPPYPCGEPGWLRDADEIETAGWFGRRDSYALNISTDNARKAMIAVAERKPFHPLRDYLQDLKWDGEPRIDYFFSEVCNVPQTKVTAAYAVAFFIQAVKRVFEPGCTGRLMLVLEGPQNKGKSTMVEILGGAGFYADIGIPPNDKDFYQAIQGMWIVEISEMASFHKAENAHIKRAISVKIDRFRKSYGHNTEDFPRQCVFVGTVNNNEWQRDETGGTRFMPIWVEHFELDLIREWRDQLWAEAVHRYRQGEVWWLLPDEAREEQESRFQDDIWAQPVIRWLEGKGDDTQYASDQAGKIRTTTSSEILYRALNLEHKKHDRQHQTRVGNLMARLGWSKKYKRTGNVRVYVYQRPAEKPPEESA